MNDYVIVWDIETIPDLKGFAAANFLLDKTDTEIREAMGDKFPKHIYHRNFKKGVGYSLTQLTRQ